ncbi:MAG: prepilin-type N-terminal cleavage/methylation domain-containing protein [Cyanobacteria bacterium J06649_4]
MRSTDTERGFTLFELLTVIVVIGAIAALAMPTWLNFLEGRRLTTGRDQLYSKLRDTQEKAKSESIEWQFSIRERDDFVEWAMHPKSVPPGLAQWTQLESESIQIDAETTFATAGGIYYVRFDEDGNVQYRLGRITLSSERSSHLRRCVIVSTIIGAMRKSKEQPVPRDGKLCY